MSDARVEIDRLKRYAHQLFSLKMSAAALTLEEKQWIDDARTGLLESVDALARLPRSGDGASGEDVLRDQIPADLRVALLALGPIEWGAITDKTDAQHVADFADSLRLTREEFSLEGNQALHGVYKKGTDIVVCHTGNSPNSAAHARLIDGLLNYARRLLESAPPPASDASPEGREAGETPDQVATRFWGYNKSYFSRGTIDDVLMIDTLAAAIEEDRLSSRLNPASPSPAPMAGETPRQIAERIVANLAGIVGPDVDVIEALFVEERQRHGDEIRKWVTVYQTDLTAAQKRQDEARKGVFNLDITAAPRDGTLLLLLVRQAEGDEDCGGLLEDATVGRTVGFNNFDNDGEDVWHFAGWDWCNDYILAGSGTVVGWALYPRASDEALASLQGSGA